MDVTQMAITFNGTTMRPLQVLLGLVALLGLILWIRATNLENDFQKTLPHTATRYRTIPRSIRGIVVYLTPAENRKLANSYYVSTIIFWSGLLAAGWEEQRSRAKHSS